MGCHLGPRALPLGHPRLLRPATHSSMEACVPLFCRKRVLIAGPGRAEVWARVPSADSPSLATSPMGTLCFWAMYPRKEKTTKPEEKLVRELTEVVMMASL